MINPCQEMSRRLMVDKNKSLLSDAKKVNGR